MEFLYSVGQNHIASSAETHWYAPSLQPDLYPEAVLLSLAEQLFALKKEWRVYSGICSAEHMNLFPPALGILYNCPF